MILLAFVVVVVFRFIWLKPVSIIRRFVFHILSALLCVLRYMFILLKTLYDYFIDCERCVYIFFSFHFLYVILKSCLLFESCVNVSACFYMPFTFSIEKCLIKCVFFFFHYIYYISTFRMNSCNVCAHDHYQLGFSILSLSHHYCLLIASHNEL